MAKFATLFLFLAALLGVASLQIAPAAQPPKEPVQLQNVNPTPLHALTGIAFHASAAEF